MRHTVERDHGPALCRIAGDQGLALCRIERDHLGEFANKKFENIVEHESGA
jgi:hypothetical protein